LNLKELRWLGVPGVLRGSEIWCEDHFHFHHLGLSLFFLVAELFAALWVGKLVSEMTPPMAIAFGYFEAFVKPFYTELITGTLTIAPPGKSKRSVACPSAQIAIVIPNLLADLSPDAKLFANANQTGERGRYDAKRVTQQNVDLKYRADPYLAWIDETNGPVVIDVPRALGSLRTFVSDKAEGQAGKKDRLGQEALAEFCDELHYRIDELRKKSKSPVEISILRA
jgi:hypothetical protein